MTGRSRICARCTVHHGLDGLVLEYVCMYVWDRCPTHSNPQIHLLWCKWADGRSHGACSAWRLRCGAANRLREPPSGAGCARKTGTRL
jgi:hypothetical protein